MRVKKTWLARTFAHQFNLALKGLQKRGQTGGVPTGIGRHLLRDFVGFSLLAPAVWCKHEALGEFSDSSNNVADELTHQTGDPRNEIREERERALTGDPLYCVPSCHVPDLVSHHARQFVLRIDQCQQATRDIDIPSGQAKALGSTISTR